MHSRWKQKEETTLQLNVKNITKNWKFNEDVPIKADVVYTNNKWRDELSHSATHIVCFYLVDNRIVMSQLYEISA